jgi:uncharacterized CHY-type Zn-finger protein
MRERFRDSEHLVRLVGLFAAGILVFLVLRMVMVPKSFGVYGHYRAGALLDLRARDPVYAGRAACADCHDDIVAQRVGSRHAQIGCESCHGALAAHAADPEAVKPELPEATPLCERCHQANVARPHGFPQVDPAEHAEGSPCTECHSPHHPEIE